MPHPARTLLGALVAASVLAAAPALSDVAGRVTTDAGVAVEGALVSHPASGTRAVTDARGRFVLHGVALPAALTVADPRFETLAVEIPAGADPPTLVLAPKQSAFESIVVTARPGLDAVAPVSISTSSIAPEELPAPTGTLVDLAAAAPGVAESGQGGRFQAYSVRGVAGQRVFTTVGGVRIVTERRAGATASFVDPSLLGSVEVVRGPASAVYGSGALGGVVQALPRRVRGTEVEIGYGSQGDETSAFAGVGDRGWTIAAAGRDQGNGENGDGAEIFNRSTQWSALVRREWVREAWAFELFALPAAARDVAKPNTRYPARVTEYPEEHHLLVRFDARGTGGWRLGAFLHPNDLETSNVRSTERSLVTNEAFDYGADARRELHWGEVWTAQVGLEYFGRRGVTATEVVQLVPSGVVERYRSLDGTEDQASLFASVRRPVGRATVEAGVRATWIGQANRGLSSHDTAGAGFVGATVPLGRGFELAANAGTGMRFPSLSERFFSGSTGRGEVIANEDLEPERSVSADLGLRYFGSRLFLELFGFRNEIDDYVEQVEIAPDVESFVNLTSGTIDGFDFDGWYAVGERWKVTWSATHLRGESDLGADLADIPSDRASAGLRFRHGKWRAAARLEHRRDKRDPGPGEVPTDAADLVSASVSRELPRGLELRLWGTNLLDETYRPSADELAVPAPGRALGVGLRWAGR